MSAASGTWISHGGVQKSCECITWQLYISRAINAFTQHAMHQSFRNSRTHSPYPTPSHDLLTQKSASLTFPTLLRTLYSTHFATPLRPGATILPGFMTWHPSYVIQKAGTSVSASTIAVGNG
jgi:hypothetical protein